MLCLFAQSCPNSLWPHGLQPTRLLCPWRFSRPGYWSGLPCPPSGNFPNPGIKPRSPALQAGSLPAEPPGNPKTTGVGSLSLLQGIFPIQESHQSLLHCRWALYQLSHQGQATHSSVPAWRIPLDRGAWWATVHGVAKSQTQLSN